MFHEGTSSDIFSSNKKTISSSERLEKRRDVLIERFKDEGIIEEHEGLLVWDFALLNNISLRHSIQSPHSHSQDQIFEALKDEVGVSKEDYERAVQKGEAPTPLRIFYFPDTFQRAFSAQDIQSNTAYAGIWDIGHRVQTWNKTITLPSGEAIRLDELFLTRKIFGDFKAFRDTDGVLKVKDAGGKEHIFSAQWFQEQTQFRGDGAGWDSPVNYLIEKCPRLQEKGLLKLSDFRTLREKSGMLYRDTHTIGIGGQVYINGANYILGSEFDARKPGLKGTMWVTELSSGIAAVVQKKYAGPEITHIFHLKSEEEKNKRLEEIKEKKGHGVNPRAYVVFKRNEVDLTPYSIAGDNLMLEGESPASYADRIRGIVKNFSFIEELSNDLSAAGIGIHDSLSWREQTWLASGINEISGSKDRVVLGAKKYGVDFLRTFLSCEFDTQNGRAILDFTENAEKAVAEALFKKYSELVQEASKIGTRIGEFFVGNREVNDAQINVIVMGLLKRAKDVLIQFATQKGQKAGTALEQLVDIKNDILTFAAVFKTLSKDVSQPIEFDEVKGIELTEMESDSIASKDKQEMERVFVANRPQYAPELLREVLKEFKDALASADKRFYMLKHEGQLIAFVRFDELPHGNLYAGSLNVRNEVRGSAIGSAMLKTVLEREGAHHTIEAVVYEKNPMLKHYLGDFGFKIVGEMPDYHGTGQKFFKIERSQKVVPLGAVEKPELKKTASQMTQKRRRAA